ncbi:MAG: hypothetical protein IAE91_01350 [Ignavibacteriaceae bacterium]|nr:hypothetical protein [Ignavibacteriaceae bacterium]
MNRFVNLLKDLEYAGSDEAKLVSFRNYLNVADGIDSLTAIAYLTGKKPKRAISPVKLRLWALEVCGVREWLFDECNKMTDDLAETISILLPVSVKKGSRTLDYVVKTYIEPLYQLNEENQHELIFEAWNSLSKDGIFIYNRLILGNFRFNISDRIISKALSDITGIPSEIISQRLATNRKPSEEFWKELVNTNGEFNQVKKPYPFCLASTSGSNLTEDFTPAVWFAEWNYKGIRCQCVKIDEKLNLFSSEYEILNDQFPDLISGLSGLPSGTVIDGVIIPANDGVISNANILQKRVNSKKPSYKMCLENPVEFIVFDILENDSCDIRFKKLSERLLILENITGKLNSLSVYLSQLLEFESVEHLEILRKRAKKKSTSGIILKKRNSMYRSDANNLEWIKFKTDPYKVIAVLIYAQKGHGRLAGFFTDYTFALKEKGRYIPFAKVENGLPEEELLEIDKFVKSHTFERFGPVCSVNPELIFEISFESIEFSKRHKSGVTVVSPKIVRRRAGLSLHDVDDLSIVKLNLLGSNTA